MTSYPNGLNGTWLPQKVSVKRPKTRDIHNEVTAWNDPVVRRAKITLQPVEIIEAGVRTLRDGVKAVIALHPDLEIGVGTIFAFRGVDYTVIQVSPGRADHQGNYHAVTCYAVVKRGGA